MSKEQSTQWHTEFESLGLDAVHMATASGHWRPDKTAAARLWLRNKWSAEFEDQGLSAVRRQIASGHWRHDKTTAARLWLQQEDGHRWQPAERRASRGSSKLRTALIKYAVAAVLILYGITRLVRLMAE